MLTSFGAEISDLRAEIIDLRAKLRAATTVAVKEQTLTALLNRIGQLVAQYRGLGQEALAARWLAEYRALLDMAAQVRRRISAGEAPSRLLLALDAVGDRAIQFTDTVVRAAEGVTAGIGMTGRILPLLLPLAIVAAAFAIGKGGLRGVLRRR